MKAHLRALILAGGPADDAAFEAEALALYAWQLAHNAQYRAFADGARPSRWQEIPAVPVGLFRELTLTCFPPEQARHVFQTSGTTGENSGFHRLLDTDIYDLGAALHARACVGPIPTGGVSLVSPAEHSSLGHMCRSFAPGLRWFFSPAHGLDREGALQALRSARQPVFVPATAFALADLIAPDDCAAFSPVTLPAGSVVMVTGGFKGRRRALSDEELASATRAAFPGAILVAEYGMTELSSQLWSSLDERAYRPPPWMRVLAVDPLSGAPATTGQLRFVDLANHQTVLAIETQDLGTVLPDGRVILHGRLEAAPLRGCSLDAEGLSGVGPGGGEQDRSAG